MSHLISPVLCHFINSTFESGVFPDELKIARVCPIYKGGGESNLQNYRPISVLSLFSKVYERVINIKLEGFLNKHNTIADCQYGFQKNKSTEDALLYIKDKIIENLENKLFTQGLFIGFRKAFDTIQHDILLFKLNHYGIRGVALTLIENYLSRRYQVVCVNKNVSDVLQIKQGVPQGSILGPLLFLLYINDLPLIKNSPELVMYADDTNIFFRSSNKDTLEKNTNDYMKDLSK